MRYREKTRKATPVNSRPGCQHRHDSIEQKPARNGRFFAISSKLSIPNRIIGNLGCPPPTVQSAKCCEISKLSTASNAANRFRKYASPTR